VLGDIAGALPPSAALPPYLVPAGSQSHAGDESDTHSSVVPPSFVPGMPYARESAPPKGLRDDGTSRYGCNAASVPNEFVFDPRGHYYNPYQAGLHARASAYNGAAHPGGFFPNGGMFHGHPEASTAGPFIDHGSYGPSGPVAGSSAAGAAISGTGAAYGGVHTIGTLHGGPPPPFSTTLCSVDGQHAGVVRAGEAFAAHTWGPPSDGSDDESRQGSPMRTESPPPDPAVCADFVDAHGHPLEMNLVVSSGFLRNTFA
jgi:hypothetical protein